MIDRPLGLEPPAFTITICNQTSLVSSAVAVTVSPETNNLAGMPSISNRLTCLTTAQRTDLLTPPELGARRMEQRH